MKQNKVFSIIKQFIPLVLVIILFVAFGGVGALSISILIIGYALFRVWKGRDQIITTMKYVETMLFGKPLDKELWNKGELKQTKVRFVWKKKKTK